MCTSRHQRIQWHCQSRPRKWVQYFCWNTYFDAICETFDEQNEVRHLWPRGAETGDKFSHGHELECRYRVCCNHTKHCEDKKLRHHSLFHHSETISCIPQLSKGHTAHGESRNIMVSPPHQYMLFSLPFVYTWITRIQPFQYSSTMHSRKAWKCQLSCTFWVYYYPLLYSDPAR